MRKRDLKPSTSWDLSEQTKRVANSSAVKYPTLAASPWSAMALPTAWARWVLPRPEAELTKRVWHTAAALAHVLSSGHGHVVGRAHHQICKRIAPERRSRAVGGQGQGQGGLLCPARHARRRCSAFLEARRSARRRLQLPGGRAPGRLRGRGGPVATPTFTAMAAGSSPSTGAAACCKAGSILCSSQWATKALGAVSCRLSTPTVAWRGAIQTLKTPESSIFLRFSEIFAHCSCMPPCSPKDRTRATQD